MSRYDEMKGNMQALYDEAVKELQELEQKRQDILKDLEFLSPICGKKTYDLKALKVAESSNKPAAAAAAGRRGGRRGGRKAAADKAVVAPKAAKVAADKATGEKKERVKEEVLRSRVMDCLNAAFPNSLSASEIFEKIESTGLPGTPSFRTRVYGKLGDWTREGILERPDRGVYRLAKKNED
jgi:hypothetical protein